MSRKLSDLKIPKAKTRSSGLAPSMPPVLSVAETPAPIKAAPMPKPARKSSVVTKRVTVSLFHDEDKTLETLERRALQNFLKVSTSELMRAAMHILTDLSDEEFVKVFGKVNKMPPNFG